MDLPNCLDCKYSDQGFPCHTAAGNYDFAKVARAVVLHGRTFSEAGDNLDAQMRDDHAWASDCAYEVEQDYPHLLLPLTVKHGPALVGEIEKLAASSAKFKYALSGIWGRANTDPDVWARVCAAVGNEGVMDTDGRGPSNGEPVTALTDEGAADVLQQPIWPVAVQLGLVKSARA